MYLIATPTYTKSIRNKKNFKAIVSLENFHLLGKRHVFIPRTMSCHASLKIEGKLLQMKYMNGWLRRTEGHEMKSYKKKKKEAAACYRKYQKEKKKNYTSHTYH